MTIADFVKFVSTARTNGQTVRSLNMHPDDVADLQMDIMNGGNAVYVPTDGTQVLPPPPSAAMVLLGVAIYRADVPRGEFVQRPA